ncbi:carboxy methyl transferase for protein phosphatase 2A [Agyrium rufum]|nr:carboxy methyl transferase for protein phosphatase 2A [Agyrium rufum]
MATPQIPTLLASRNPQRGSNLGRSRGRGGRGGGLRSHQPELTPEEQKARNDKIIQETDQDASVSRLSAVQVGYLHDPFADCFVGSGSGTPQRRFPIINRGTYVRTTAIDQLVDNFLSSDLTTRKQIISLGAGSDTRFFRLASRSVPPDVLYHELDFPANTAQKVATIRRTPKLRALAGLPTSQQGQDTPPATSSKDEVSRSPQSSSNGTTPDPQSTQDTELHTPNYHILALDMRSLTSKPPDPSALSALQSYISPNLPTLLLSECCLCYLPPSQSTTLLSTFTTTLINPTTPLALLLYEPINPTDAFGRVMLSNLASRGIALASIETYPDLESQRARMKSYGFDAGQEAVTVNEVWDECVDAEEKRRAGGLEMMDEIEEWELLARHYCLAWGWRDGGIGKEKKDEGGKDIWEGWRNWGSRRRDRVG